MNRSWAEPWKIKMVEPISVTTREHREAAIVEAGYNTFLLKSDDVYIDLLTDSGTTAMSDRQWAAMMIGDESYAGARSFYKLVEAVRDVYGYEELIPTHQGRGAEHILSQILISPGDVVPGNMYFTTTRYHQERAGGTFVDVIIDEAHDPTSMHPFKGNIDLDKLTAVVEEFGAERVAYVSFETNVNLAGGQPASMANIKAVYDYCSQRGILVMLDATRAVENAYMIQQREAGYEDSSVASILSEITSYSDGAWRRLPKAFARWSGQTTTFGRVSVRSNTLATGSSSSACRSSHRSVDTVSFSMQPESLNTLTKTSSQLRRWQQRSTSIPECAAWSGGLFLLEGTH
jgi:tyrosine phenol-lyase